MSRIFLNLLSQFKDMIVHSTCRGIFLISPDLVQQIVPVNHLGLMDDKIFQDLHFQGCEFVHGSQDQWKGQEEGHIQHWGPDEEP